jgi:hypothetical protein
MINSEVFFSKINLRIKHSQIILILIIINFLADATNSILESSGAEFFRFSIIPRSITTIYFLFLALQNKSGRNLWKIVIFFYTVFLLGTLSGYSLYEGYNLFTNFSAVNKLLYFFICYVTFKYYFRTKEEKSQLLQVFEYVLLIESITVLVGFIFHIDILSSYQNRRFGYKGIIPAQNEASGFFLIAFFYYLMKVDILGSNALKLILVMIAGLITGTKVALILPILLIVQLVIWYSKGKIKVGRIYLGLTFVLLIGLALYFKDYILSRYAPTIAYYEYRASTSGDNLIYVLFSGRLARPYEFITNYLPRFDLLNILFGGLDRSVFASETDVIDVFAQFGIVGLLMFFTVYIRLLFQNGKNLNSVSLLFPIIWLGVAATAGHTVFSAINGGYLAILLMAFAYMGDYKRSILIKRGTGSELSD